jgi:hypothetical protein
MMNYRHLLRSNDIHAQKLGFGLFVGHCVNGLLNLLQFCLDTHHLGCSCILLSFGLWQVSVQIFIMYFELSLRLLQNNLVTDTICTWSPKT